MDLARRTRRPPTTLKVGLNQSSNNIINYLAYLLPDRSRISKRKASGNRSGEFKSSIKYHVSHVSSTKKLLRKVIGTVSIEKIPANLVNWPISDHFWCSCKTRKFQISLDSFSTTFDNSAITLSSEKIGHFRHG